MNRHDRTVVVLGFGAEPYLEECLDAVRRDHDETLEVLLVDNGITDLPRRLPRLADLARIIGDGKNLGFAGGCNLAAAAATGGTLVFLNSDALVRRGAVERIVAAANEPGAGIVGGCLRLADQPDLVNSAGNPLHYTGVSWAGGCGESASMHDQRGAVAIATGGFFAVRRELWDELGGFDADYFAYHEDADLCLRARLAGHRVDFEPAAVADHHYEFSRNPRKLYLLERNRLRMLLVDYPRPLLLAVLPAVLALEPLLLVLAVSQGWGVLKLRAWFDVVRQGRQIRARRREVQAGVRVEVADLVPFLVARIEPTMVDRPPLSGVLNAMLASYWQIASRPLRRTQE